MHAYGALAGSEASPEGRMLYNERLLGDLCNTQLKDQ